MSRISEAKRRVRLEAWTDMYREFLASGKTIKAWCEENGMVVEDNLVSYSGYLQTDGYSAYNAAVNATRVGCWFHARRKWVECLPKGIEDKNSKAAQAHELVEQIFAEDKRLEGLPVDKVYAQRLECIKPLLERY